MKKECFAVRQAQLTGKENSCIQGFTLQLYAFDCCSILCDELGTRELLMDFFLGRAVLQSGRFFWNRQEFDAGAFMRRMQKEAAVISPRDKLIHTWSVSENICLCSREKKWKYKKRFHERTKKLIDDFSLDLPYEKKVDELSPKERVFTELLKAYVEKRRLVILAGLSTLLPQKNMEELFELVQCMLAEKQQISFVMIDNPGEIPLQWSERVKIIKSHRDYGCFQTALLNRRKLYEFYAGNRTEYNREWKQNEEEDTGQEAVFSFEHVSTLQLQNICFDGFGGKFLKIFCQDTESMEEIYRAVSGEDEILTGKICMMSVPVSLDTLQNMRKHGVFYCKARAYESMLFLDLSARDNILLELSKKIKNPYMQKKYRKSVDEFITKTLGPGKASCRVEYLNVIERQKLAFLKIYMMAPKVLLCEQPFFDADARMKEVTIEALQKLVNRGIAVIVLTIQLDIMEWFEGDELYISGGKSVSKAEIYPLS